MDFRITEDSSESLFELYVLILTLLEIKTEKFENKNYQQGCRGRRMGGKVQGIRSINGSYKIDRRRLTIVQEMEKPNNVHV